MMSCLRILSTDASGCFFINVTFTAVAEISIRGDFFFKSYHKFSEFNLFFIHPILFWIDELIHLHSIYISSMNIEFHLWYENYRHFEIYLQWKCLNFNNNFTEVYSHTVFETLPVGAKSLPILTPDYCHPPQSNFTECKQDMVAVFFMHLSMVNELISKPCTSWVSVS